MLLNSGHGGQQNDAKLGANILWGDKQGISANSHSSVVKEQYLGCSSIADLDHDGYLDLVLGAFDVEKDSRLVIRYGSSEGYNDERRVVIEVPHRSIGTVIADVDNNRNLDIVIACIVSREIRIYKNSPKGFAADRFERLHVPSPIEVEAADLNADGWIDLIVPRYVDACTGLFDGGVTIFWGGPEGYSTNRTQWLRASCALGVTVADFDADGHLDVFLPSYHANGTQELIPSWLYWGGDQGFTANRRTPFITNSASDALAGDFNADGALDLAVSCHARNDSHHVDSLVFLNQSHRFVDATPIRLPTRGVHWMYMHDMGHIMHRRWEQSYTSRPYVLQTEVDHAELTADLEVPDRAEVEIEWRTAVDSTELEKSNWRRFTGNPLPLTKDQRTMQYRVTFRSRNGDAYPTLSRVLVDFFTASDR